MGTRSPKPEHLRHQKVRRRVRTQPSSLTPNHLHGQHVDHAVAEERHARLRAARKALGM